MIATGWALLIQVAAAASILKMMVLWEEGRKLSAPEAAIVIVVGAWLGAAAAVMTRIFESAAMAS